MSPRLDGVCDRSSPGEPVAMMNDRRSALYRPTKSCTYHDFTLLKQGVFFVLNFLIFEGSALQWCSGGDLR